MAKEKKTTAKKQKASKATVKKTTPKKNASRKPKAKRRDFQEIFPPLEPGLSEEDIKWDPVHTDQGVDSTGQVRYRRGSLIDSTIRFHLRYLREELELISNSGGKTLQSKRARWEEETRELFNTLAEKYDGIIESLQHAKEKCDEFNRGLKNAVKKCPEAFTEHTDYSQGPALDSIGDARSELKSISQRLTDLQLPFGIWRMKAEDTIRFYLYSGNFNRSTSKRKRDHPSLERLVDLLAGEGLDEEEAWARIVEIDKGFDPPRPLKELGTAERNRERWHTYWMRRSE